MKLITSETNPTIKIAKRLATSNRFCKMTGTTLAEGIHLAQEILRLKAENEDGVMVDQVFLSKGDYEESVEINTLIQRFEGEGIEVNVVPLYIYRQLSPVENSAGIVCQVDVPKENKEYIEGDYVFLDRIQDPGNMGTTIRTALAAGIKNIAISKHSAWPWTPKTLRAGMGAQLYVNIWLDADLEEIKEKTGNECLLADAQEGENLYEAKWGKKPTIWVFGNEGKGISEELLESGDKKLLIPIAPQAESLNVGAAAAVCLFEQKRRRDFSAEDDSRKHRLGAKPKH